MLDLDPRSKALVAVFPKLRRLGVISAGCFNIWIVAPSLHGAVMAQTADVQSPPLELKHVVEVIGLDGLKPKSAGKLVFDNSEMAFVSGKTKTVIAMRSIRAFSVAHDTVALVGGAKGFVVGMAPYGAGMAVKAIRPGVEVLTMVYADDNRAIHGTVLILPKGKSDDVVRALAKAGFSPSLHPETGLIDPTASADAGAVKDEPGVSHGRSSVRVALPAESADGVPAAYAVGIYEELVAQLTKSGLFATVWRQGDTRIDPDALTLRVNIEQLKKGNARMRALVPLTGPTVIKADIELTDSGHTLLLRKDVDGAVRLSGENMAATKSLAKNIKTALTKLPSLGPASGGGGGRDRS